MSYMKELLAEQVTKIYEDTGIPEEMVYAYFDNVGSYTDDIDQFAAEIADATYGYWECPEDFARDTLNSFVDADNEWWSQYIDYKRMGEELLHTDYFAVDFSGGIWVFRNI